MTRDVSPPSTDTDTSSEPSVALKIHRYLVTNHLRDGGLVGPDPGVRWNYRVGRFVKSYLCRLPWKDDLYYLQAQGYWVWGNWALFDLTGDATYRDLAIAASRRVLRAQRPDGSWDYPHPEWRGRVASVEGMWGCEALLESYGREGDPDYLDGAHRWHRFLMRSIGFQRFGDELALNYFAGSQAAPVPNNSTDALQLLAKFAKVTGDPSYLEPCSGMIRFLRAVQMESGELPYQVAKHEGHGRNRPHFQCFQYNAFECLGLMGYHQLSGDAAVQPLIEGVLTFLRGGVAEDGAAHYACGIRRRKVTYHAAALAAAFTRAGQLGLAGFDELSTRGYDYVRGLQRSDGGFRFYSRWDYPLVNDRRSYPRYLAMIMYHFLIAESGRSPAHGSTG